MGLRNLVVVGWLISILAAGCTGSELASLPGDMSDVAAVGAPTRVLKVGDNAKITLRSGATIEGEVMAASAEAVTLVRVGNNGREEREIRASEIAAIDRVTVGSSWLVFAGVAVGTVVLLAKDFFERLD